MCWEEARVHDGDGDGSGVDNSGPRDVPFIATYRKELVGFPGVLNTHGVMGERVSWCTQTLTHCLTWCICGRSLACAAA